MELALFPSSCKNKNYETDFLGTSHNWTQQSRLHLLSFLPDNVDRLSYWKMYAFNQKQDDGKSLMYVRMYFGFLLKIRDK